MEDTAFFLLMLLEVLVAGGLLLLYPRIVRRGLLFGVYVGEQVWQGEAARAITRSWYKGMIACLLLSVVASTAFWLAAPRPWVAVVPSLVLFGGFFALYLQAYWRSRALAVAGMPVAVAPLEQPAPTGAILPALALVLGAGCGLFAIVYAGSHYGDLPDPVPTHFGISGEPDAWRPKSFFTVMLMPILVFVMGVSVGGAAWLVAHAKRAVRHADRGVSLSAQMRFRTALTRFLSTIAILTTVMTTSMSVSAIRIALREQRSIPPLTVVAAVALGLFALGGSLYIALRYGQGGSRLERAAGDAPLTDGLADNRHWILGTFYVNRDDPSFMVEHRFGLGYTINFGNWRAVAVLVAFLVIVLGLTITAVITN
jgi:uncharacterized membrane protein